MPPGVVKAFVREDYEIGKFHGVSKYVYQLLPRRKRSLPGIPRLCSLSCML